MADRPPPSAAAIAIGTAIVSGLMGYYIGQAQSIGVFGGSQKSPATLSGVSRAKGKDEAEDEDEDDDDDDGEEEEEEESIEGLKSFDGNTEECKMVFVVRTDLGMTKGKLQSETLRR
jgi:PTH2 family peptidyl-tRNA hydrolase